MHIYSVFSSFLIPPNKGVITITWNVKKSTTNSRRSTLNSRRNMMPNGLFKSLSPTSISHLFFFFYISDEYTNLLQTVGNHLSLSSNTSQKPVSPISATTAPHISTPTVPKEYVGLTHDNATTRFPAIRFWTKASFTEDLEAKKPSRQKATVDIMEVNTAPATMRKNRGNNKGEPIPFAEYKEGSIMNESTSAAVHSLLRQVFNEMGDWLPQKWGDVSLTDSQYVYSQLYKHYPCFLLCHDDWKAAHLVSRTLTSFHGTHKKKDCKLQQHQDVKIEPKDKPEDEKTSDSGKKRKSASLADDNKESPSKRLHTEPPPSSPPLSSGLHIVSLPSPTALLPANPLALPLTQPLTAPLPPSLPPLPPSSSPLPPSTQSPFPLLPSNTQTSLTPLLTESALSSGESSLCNTPEDTSLLGNGATAASHGLPTEQNSSTPPKQNKGQSLSLDYAEHSFSF